MNSETTIARATGASAIDVANLINSAYRAEGDIAGWTNEVGLLAGTRIDPASLDVVLRADTPAILLIRRKVDETLFGCISVEPLSDAIWYISLLAIRPSEQNLGYGRKLLLEAENFAQSHGAQATRISVIGQQTKLIAWYERRGYRQTGEILPFPYDDPTVGKPLREDLQLVVLEKSLKRSHEECEANGSPAAKFARAKTSSTIWMGSILAALALSYSVGELCGKVGDGAE